MKWFLFENKFALFAALIAIQLILISSWSWRRSPATARAVWIGFSTFPAFLIISHLIVTDREKVILFCKDFARHLEHGRAEEINLLLAPEFQASGFDRKALVDRLQKTLSTFQVSAISVTQVEATGNGDWVTAELNATCDLATNVGYLGRLPTRWKISCRRMDTQLLLVFAETVPIPPLNARSLEQLFG